MAPLHRVYFLGNVIQDPEAWSAPNGTAVARCGYPAGSCPGLGELYANRTLALRWSRDHAGSTLPPPLAEGACRCDATAQRAARR